MRSEGFNTEMPPLDQVLPSLEEGMRACSEFPAQYDGGNKACLRAVNAVMGGGRIIIEDRSPDGSGSRKMVAMRKPALGQKLMEQACSHDRWEACMIYVEFLHQGREYQKNDAYAVALMQWACAGGHGPACSMLAQSRIPIKRPAEDPVSIWGGATLQPSNLCQAGLAPMREPPAGHD